MTLIDPTSGGNISELWSFDEFKKLLVGFTIEPHAGDWSKNSIT